MLCFGVEIDCVMLYIVYIYCICEFELVGVVLWLLVCYGGWVDVMFDWMLIFMCDFE